MRVLRTVREVRRVLDPLRIKTRIAFVPTMGALHEGHVALFRSARSECDHVIASIFVNPLQFNQQADLDAYPRPESRDAELAANAGVEVLFVPSVEEIYPPDHATIVDVRGPALGFEGAQRPGHFSGVATVVMALFSIVRPDVTYFGQKDAQQVAVIKRLIADLHLPIELRVVPTVREADGLARSSRNARLSPDERRRASSIPDALRAGVRAYQRGDDPLPVVRAALHPLDVEYVEIAAFDLEPTLVVAVTMGSTRLIDNVPLDHPERAGL